MRVALDSHMAETRRMVLDLKSKYTGVPPPSTTDESDAAKKGEKTDQPDKSPNFVDKAAIEFEKKKA